MTTYKQEESKTRNEKYLWGTWNNKNYALLVVIESKNQVVFRLIGTQTHLTLHNLKILKETPDFYLVEYQTETRELSKKHFIPISWDLSDPKLRNTWSDATVDIAGKMKFSNPEKHGYSVQNLLNINAEKTGCCICGVRIKINNSMTKQTYLNIGKKMGEIIMPSDNFMLNFIFMGRKNKSFRGSYGFVVNALRGKVCLKIEDSV